MRPLHRFSTLHTKGDRGEKMSLAEAMSKPMIHFIIIPIVIIVAFAKLCSRFCEKHDKEESNSDIL